MEWKMFFNDIIITRCIICGACVWIWCPSSSELRVKTASRADGRQSSPKLSCSHSQQSWKQEALTSSLLPHLKAFSNLSTSAASFHFAAFTFPAFISCRCKYRNANVMASAETGVRSRNRIRSKWTRWHVLYASQIGVRHGPRDGRPPTGWTSNPLLSISQGRRGQKLIFLHVHNSLKHLKRTKLTKRKCLNLKQYALKLLKWDFQCILKKMF